MNAELESYPRWQIVLLVVALVLVAAPHLDGSFFTRAAEAWLLLRMLTWVSRG